jgi:hypothetical protein
MKFTIYFLTVALACALIGCASRGQTYAQQHPELSAAQRQIFATGKIPDGAAVAGMTREQVQLAMGMDPAQYTKIDGQDAWVFVSKKLSPMPLTTTRADFQGPDNRNRSLMDEPDNQAPQNQAQTKTTVIFSGERAVRADVVNGGL